MDNLIEMGIIDEGVSYYWIWSRERREPRQETVYSDTESYMSRRRCMDCADYRAFNRTCLTCACYDSDQERSTPPDSDTDSEDSLRPLAR